MRMPLIVCVAGVLATSATRSVGDACAQTAPSARPTAAIAWQLVGEPSTTITMAQRRSFRLWMVARNTGSTTVDTGRDRLEFTVNGASSMVLGMAFGNGVRTREWNALPSGRSVREARDMGEILFPAPGTYVIAMRLDGAEVARLSVTVRR